MNPSVVPGWAAVGSIRRIVESDEQVAHRSPSGPGTIPTAPGHGGPRCRPREKYSLTVCVEGSMLPIRPLLFSTNHSCPSDPTAIPSGLALGVAVSLKRSPVAGSSSPIFPAPYSVNHRCPSGPATIPDGFAPPLSWVWPDGGYSLTAPLALTRPIFPASNSVNHIAPSGPFVIPLGTPPAVNPVVNSVTIGPLADADESTSPEPTSPAATSNPPTTRPDPRITMAEL